MGIPQYEIPLFKPLSLFIFGIITAEHFPSNIRLSSLLIYASFGLLSVLLILSRINNFTNSLIVTFLFFSLGYINHQERNLNQWTETIADKECIFTVKIDKILVHKKHKKCFVQICSQLNKEKKLINTKGKLLVYFKNMSKDSTIEIGNEYLIKAKALPIQKSNNPHSFDYERHLRHEGIYHQLFVDENQFSLVRKNQNSIVKQMILSIRNHCLHVFRKYFHEPDKQGILYAMVLGNRDCLSDELNQAFIDTGAIHVLAVSGLHVGILCLFVGFVFKVFEPIVRISSRKRGIISVIIIWVFAMITGASAAVCRAALMFTLFYIAKDILHRKVSIYNVLCGTAFLLLAINPNQLFQVGFQFSFLAVLSIVFFYPFINEIYVSKYKLLNYFYSSVSIGIAAQILVFPLGIFYFNKFANSFLITSLFVVQFAMIILIGGLSILVFEFTGLEMVNQKVLVPFMDLILEKLQAAIEWVQSMPFSYSENLWLSSGQVVLIYFCVISMMYYLKQGRKYFYVALIFLFGLINYSIHLKLNKSKQQLVYIYDAQALCIDVFLGNKGLHLGPTLKEQAPFIYARNRMAHAIEQVYPIELNKNLYGLEYEEGLMRLGESILAFANVDTFDSLKKDQVVDYILVTKDASQLEKIDLVRIVDSEIILDGSLQFWERDKLLKFAQANGLKVYDIKTKGAKVIRF